MDSENRAKSRGTFSNSPTPPITKGKRATHRKSRQGCARCKKRRVKCDEGKPACKVCVNRGETCHYADVSNCHSCGCLDCDCVSTKLSNDVDLTDFEFTFHYARYTYDTLIEEPTNEKIRPLLAPPASLSYPFILDLQLALAASHLACLNPAQSASYAGHAFRYQNRALEKFKDKLQGPPKPEDCLPMFSFSASLGLLHLAHSRVPGLDGYPVDCVLTFIELGQLWRGCRSILTMSREVLPPDVYMETFETEVAMRETLQSGWTSKFIHELQRVPLVAADAFILEMEHLEALLNEECELVKLDIFRRSLKILRLVSRFHNTNRPALMLAFSVACPEEYIELLRNGDPHARLILGLYATLLHRLDMRWWLKGYAQDLMNEVAANPVTARHAQMHARCREILAELSARTSDPTWTSSEFCNMVVDDLVGMVGSRPSMS